MSISDQAKRFCYLCDEIVARIEENDEEWWDGIASLSWELEETRRALGFPEWPYKNDPEWPAFLIFNAYSNKGCEGGIPAEFADGIQHRFFSSGQFSSACVIMRRDPLGEVFQQAAAWMVDSSTKHRQVFPNEDKKSLKTLQRWSRAVRDHFLNDTASRVSPTPNEEKSSGPDGVNDSKDGLEGKRKVNKKHVFLSYCREDESDVGRIRDDLIAEGEDVWWDRDILPGQDWKLAIRQAMNDAYAVVACFSAATDARNESGMFSELRNAIEAYRKCSPGSIFLIPVRLSGATIPDFEIDSATRLGSLQYVDLFPDSQWVAGIAKLVAAVQGTPHHPTGASQNAASSRSESSQRDGGRVVGIRDGGRVVGITDAIAETKRQCSVSDDVAREKLGTSTTWTKRLKRLQERFEDARRNLPRVGVLLIEHTSSKSLSEEKPPLFRGPLRQIELSFEGERIWRYYQTAGDEEAGNQLARIAADAARDLAGLLPKLQHLAPFGLQTAGDAGVWIYAVFVLAWRDEWDKATRRVWHERFDSELDKIHELRQLGYSELLTDAVSHIPDPPTRWYSVLDDLAGASVATIDVLLSLEREGAHE